MGITIFTPAPLPFNERHRSEAARASSLLHRTADPELSRIANDVRHVMDVEWCGITLIIDESKYIIASSGGMIGVYQRSTSLCSYIVSDPNTVFVIPDTKQDERFVGNPNVDSGKVRFFAGAAIRDRAGYAIGGLCLNDGKPRNDFSKLDENALQEFANLISIGIG